MSFPEEVEKAAKGEPSRVRFDPDAKMEGSEVEASLESAGYEYAFGLGFKSREEMIKRLLQPGAKEPAR